ncbi:molybdopterin-containing oxidoreductase family protein [Streptomyces profundus]|uniref:molybdopterin-containing oxidoreductase family protein n=1 Tax=Streptomyces profundus TaxID=2867410 RepID=UPI001D16435A|nr:molybdopterin-dependent oxidoreductase [Streptomyces sp. MA3_2.13]UED87553.1 molybdopterin-dependent oxidoreductase [Streptomyces sp. MA3_2.13]
MTGETSGVSRRGLMRTGAGLGVPALLPVIHPSQASAGTPAAGSGAGTGAARLDGSELAEFTEGSAALTPDRTARTACQFCNANCGLRVDLKADRILAVRGEADDPVQRGQLCVKAGMMPQLTYNERRLTTPLIRVGGAKGSGESRFAAATWDEALRTIAERLLELRDAGQAHTIANRTTGRLPRGTGSLVARLFAMLGSPNNTDVGPVCNDAGANALTATFGLGNFTNGYGVDGASGQEDLGAARHHLFLGTNQAETHPVTFDHLLRARETTGATLTVVDPRLTPTGALADRWVAPKPHTDLALLLGMLYHIVERDLYDAEFVDRWVTGFAELRDHLAHHGHTPRWAAGITDVPAATIEAMAEEYAAARPAAIFCNAGISHQLGAFDTYRVITFLAAVTGNIGRAGGGCNFMHNTWPGDLRLPPLDVDLPEPATAALPVGPDYFAESILTGRPYGLRAVLTQGNPLVSSANTAKVKEAFAALDFYVYAGLFMEEAADYADVVLPVCAGLETEGVYMRRDDRAIRWQERVLAPVGESRPDWQIWIGLAHALAELDTRRPAAEWRRAFPSDWMDYGALWAEFVAHTPGMGGMSEQRLADRAEPLRWPCPSPEHPGVSTLYLDHPSWYEAAESLDAAHRGKRFLTPSGTVEITTPALQLSLASAGHDALPTFYTHPEVTGGHPTVAYGTDFVTNPVNPQALTHPVRLGVPGDGAVHRRYPLMGMTGRPSVVHFASVTHWTDTGKQLNGIRFVQIHPATARAAGIADGAPVRVESPRGSVTGTALLWEGIRRDTVFVPNTFGPAQESGDLFQTPRYEAANTLVDDRYYDNLSGQQAYKCFACRVVAI